MNLENILDNNGNPSHHLLKLLDLFELKHTGSLQSIVEITQKEWLRKIRPPGVERWQIDPKIRSFFELKRSQAMPLFQQMGFYYPVIPQKKEYNYLLLFGHPLFDFCRILLYVFKLRNTDPLFEKWVILTGRRFLDPEKENREVFKHIFSTMLPSKNNYFLQPFPHDETELIEYIMDSVVMPEQWSSISLEIIDAPMKHNEHNILVRPTTGDTVDQWLLKNPKPGSILAVSNQPYCKYQESVLKTLMPSFFTIETIGDIPNKEDDYIVLYLDTLARFLYQENKRKSDSERF